jgi:hypothetical protein
MASKDSAINNTETAEVILCKMKYVFNKPLQAVYSLGLIHHVCW